MQTIDIYRDGALLITIKPEGNSAQNKAVMGENVLQVEFLLSSYLEFKVGDSCEVFGETYCILEMPNVTKRGQFTWAYNVKFDVEGQGLKKYQYLFLDSSNQYTEPDFALMGDGKLFLDLLITNANREDSGWTLGEVIPTGYKNITFLKDNCLSALAKIAEAFGTEYFLEGKRVHLTKKATDSGVTFKHGKRKGLYEIQRQKAAQSGLITRLYPFGSEKNLPPSYGNKRLRLPGDYNPCLISNLTATYKNNGNGTQTITFNFTPARAAGISTLVLEYRVTGTTPWTTSGGNPLSPRVIHLPLGSYDFRFTTVGQTCSGVYTPVISMTTSSILIPQFVSVPIPYLENNVAEHGLIEHTEFFEDIYPTRTGKVTGVNSVDFYKFVDSTMDFDPFDYLLPGTAPKLTFNTGQLAGYTFDLKSYDAGTKTITIFKNKDERALDIPSSAIKPAIGDEYVFTDIQLPQSYVIAAENKLLEEATKFLLLHSRPQYSYQVTIDPVFIQTYNIKINIGDEVWLTDQQLGVNRKIRIVNLVRNIVSEDSYQIQLSDTIAQSTIQRLNDNLQSVQQGVSNVAGQVQNNAILNGVVIGRLKFEDMPETNTTAGFLPVYLNAATRELYVKV